MLKKDFLFDEALSNNQDYEMEFLTFPNVELSKIAEKESWRKEIYRPLYHIHKWWAIRLGSIFRGIILSALSKQGSDIWGNFYKIHNFSEKIILDPFMGSGTTLGEAIKLGAKAIGSDINPVSTFIVKQAFSNISEEELKIEFYKLEQNVAEKIGHFYRTIDPKTSEKIPVLYYFWVKIVTTPQGEQIPLFSNYIFSQNAYPKKKPEVKIICPGCWTVISDVYTSTSTVCPKCQIKFNPQIGPVSGQTVISKDGTKYKIRNLIPQNGTPLQHRLYAVMAIQSTGKKIYLPVTDIDLALYKEAEEQLSKENLPLPLSSVRQGKNTDQARSYNYLAWRDFFNSRQLLCLGYLLNEILNIEKSSIREQMLCLFSSTLEFNNLFCSFKGEGTGAVRHMFSNHILKPERTPLENSVWGSPQSSGTFSTL
ncbi:MAG: hypothetical protein LBT07_02680, partial [Endomicrobium sp.]|nr:hypothetical protein [Endomicrobium sp.]